jgi:hypothetical protein
MLPMAMAGAQSLVWAAQRATSHIAWRCFRFDLRVASVEWSMSTTLPNEVTRGHSQPYRGINTYGDLLAARLGYEQL